MLATYTGVIDSFNFIDNPWESTSKEIQSATIESISDFTAEQYPELPRTHPGFLHEVAMGGAGILSSIATWSKLNADNGCILLANQIESRVVQKVFGSQNTAGLSSFSEIVSARIPNPEALSWQRIVDLRRSPYLEDFRRKLDIIESQVNKGDIKGVAELISEIEMNDLRRLARAVEPSMGTSSIKALLDSD